MLTSEILELINDIEFRFSVDKWTVKGIKIWPLIRIRLNFDLFYAHHTSIVDTREVKGSKISKGIRIIKGLFSYFNAYIFDCHKNISLNKSADVVFLNDGKSFVNINEQWYDRMCDPLIDLCNAHNVTFRMLTPTYNFIIPRRSPSKFIQPFLDYIRISTFIKSRNARDFCYHLPGYNEFCLFIEEKKVGITAPTIEYLFQQISLICGYTSYFRSILSKIKPNVACVVCYYSLEGMALSLACKQLNIPIIDLQHGIQGDLHAAYGRWNNVPITGYDLLPSFFWSWNQSDVVSIEKWSSAVANFHSPLLGGNLWLNFWKNPNNNIVCTYDRLVNKLKVEKPYAKRILVTLQFSLDDKKTLAPLLNAIRRSDASWIWWIRLHPGMLDKREYIRKTIMECGNNNFELDMTTDLPLYALLRHSDVHVTHSSSTVIEAEQFGVPSVIFNSYGREFFPDQIASGWALFAGDDNVNDAITKQIKLKSPSSLLQSHAFTNIAVQKFLTLATLKQH